VNKRYKTDWNRSLSLHPFVGWIVSAVVSCFVLF